MAIKCGFFNSINRDRRYSAEDMNEPYAGIVSNGVLVPNEDLDQANKTASTPLKVVANAGLNVKVNSGRGIFAQKWFVSDSDIILNVPANNTLEEQKASVVVQIDNRSDHRTAKILLVQTSDKKSIPPINQVENVFEYRLANISIKAGVSAITTADIEDTRPTKDCGFVHGLIKQLSTAEIYSQYEAIFYNWFNNIQVDLKTNSTLITKLESSFTTVAPSTTEIPINIPQYNQTLDALEVYVNGLQLVKDLEYKITVGDNTKITLVKDVYPNTIVSFIVYKSIQGSEAATVVAQVNNLQNQVNKLSEDSGWINFTLEGGAVAYPGMQPAVRKVGNTVYIRGAIHRVTNAQQVVCTLPEAYAPVMEHYFSQVVGGTGPGVGYAVVRFKVNRNRASGGTATITLNGATGALNADMTIPLSTSFVLK